MTYELPVFKTSHNQTLISHVKDNKDRYSRKTTWAAGDESKTCVPSGIMVSKNIETILDPKASDFANAVAIHQALILTPREASNPMLWARLSHVEMWDYMRSRWDATTKGPGFVQTRYFVIRNNSRILMRNGLARLWWAAHLTYSERDYHNTEILISQPEIAERSFARSPLILQTLLRFISYKEKSVKGRSHFRRLLRRFNELGGTKLLIELSQSEIESFLEKSFEQILKNMEKENGKSVARTDE